MHARSLCGVLLLSSALFAAEPPSTPARRPVAQPLLRPASTALDPFVTSNGDGFLALWSDGRYGNSDIFGARYDASGELVDRAAFPVHSTWRSDYLPSAVWDGEDYLTFAPAEHMGTFPLRISEDAEVRDAAPLFPAQVGFQRSLGWNGTRYGAVMHGAEMPPSFVVLTRELAVERRTPLVAAGETISHARVAAGGGEFLVVFENIAAEGDRVFVQRFSASGTAIGERILLATQPLPEWAEPASYPGTMKPAVVWNGDSFVAVWTDDSGVRGARIEDGVASAPFVIATEAEARDVAIAFDGIAHLVVWNRTFPEYAFQTVGAFVTGSGTVLETFAIGAKSGWQPPPAVASNGEVFLVLASRERFVIDATAPARIIEHDSFTTELYPAQRQAAIAPGAANLLAAWYEEGSVYAGRLARSGQPLDGGGIRLSTTQNYGALPVLDVVSNGTTYLVVWQEHNDITRGARVTAEGEVLDPGGFDIAHGASPRAAARGDVFLVSWTQLDGLVPPAAAELVAAAMPARGPFTLEPKPIAAESPYHQNPLKMLVTPDGFALLWQQNLAPPCYGRLCPPTPFRIVLSRADAHGDFVAEFPLLENQQVLDAVLTDGELLLVLRQSLSHFTQRFDLEGKALGERVAVPLPPNALVVRLAENRTILFSAEPAGLPPGAQWRVDTRALPLDRNGAPIVEAPLAVLGGIDSPSLTDVVFDGARLWMTYTARWYAVPQSHSSWIDRAYVEVLGGRRRALR